MNVEFIAEISSNHNQNLQRSLRFIDESARIGCDGVKFQLFKVEELFSPEVFVAKPEVKKRKQWELPLDFLPELSDRCHHHNMKFGVTPFYLQAVEELFQFVDFYKIASYELLWSDLLRACAETKKPVIVSTGMATMDEINSAVKVLRTSRCKDLTLLHCVSGYPAPPHQCNLAAINTIRQAFCCSDLNDNQAIAVGWSDHSVNPGVVYRAIHRWGAKVIEFHLDLDGTGEEYETGHCWLPESIKDVIDDVKTGISSDGNGVKSPVPIEESDRKWRADPLDGLRPLRSMRATLDKE